jgi:hypothetical protein
MALRNTIAALALGFLLLTTGCATHPIPTHFSPLEDIVERTIGSDDFVTTFHNDVYVDNIESFLERKPEGSPQYNATMIHERIHSIRMGNIFSTLWFSLVYLFDTDFMWEEEQIGWYFQLKYMQKKGILKPVEATAAVLSKYENLVGNMVSYNDALAWVRDVLAGRWEPDLSAEEWELYGPPKETE